MFQREESYTPREAKETNEILSQLVAAKKMTPHQAGAHRTQIARRVRIALKPAYTPQAARRAKTEIQTLTEIGTIPTKSSAAYRAHITKRTA